jgi:hypothetical protein
VNQKVYQKHYAVGDQVTVRTANRTFPPGTILSCIETPERDHSIAAYPVYVVQHHDETLKKTRLLTTSHRYLTPNLKEPCKCATSVLMATGCQCGGE